MIWLAFALSAAAAAAFLLWPLLRAPAAFAPRTAYDAALYRAQRAELDRERARGTLTEAEHAAALLEVQRRLLAAARADEAAEDGPGAAGGAGHRAARFLLAGTALAVPLLALALYLPAGSPEVPAMPLAERRAAAAVQEAEVERLLAQLRARLAALPPGSEEARHGWLLLGNSERSRGNYTSAAEAFARAEAIRPDPDLAADRGEMLAAAAGRITPAARAAFEVALAARPTGPGSERARFFVGLADFEAGAVPAALARWRALEADAPADAPWLAVLRRRIAEAEAVEARGAAPGAAGAAPGAAPGPDAAALDAAAALPPEQRQAMIVGMVDRLAARLRESPADAEGWLRLARARLVLRDWPAAEEAAGRLRALRPEALDGYTIAAEAMGRAAAGSPPPLALLPLMRAALAQPGAEADRRVLWFAGLAEATHGDHARAAALWRGLLAQMEPGSPAHAALAARIAALEAPAGGAPAAPGTAPSVPAAPAAPAAPAR